MPEESNNTVLSLTNSGLALENADRAEQIPANEEDCGLACCETCESPFCIVKP